MNISSRLLLELNSDNGVIIVHKKMLQKKRMKHISYVK